MNNLRKGAVRDETNQNTWWKVVHQHDINYMNFLNTIYMSSDGIDLKYIDFIEDYRIELNTIMDEVGAQRFWYWLKDKLIETFPKRDYNRAITVPPYVLTDTMQYFQDKLNEKLTLLLKPHVNNIEAAYQDTNRGLLKTLESSKYTKKYLKNVLEENDSINEIDSDLQNILEKLE